MSFETIAKKTYCPFARASKMGAPITVTGTDVKRELRACGDAIASFFRDARGNCHDGLLITFDADVAPTLDALALLTKRFYEVMSELFPGVDIPSDPGRDDPWLPMIEGERFFLVSFAPCYAKDSPRYNHGDARTFFLLQPASTFERNAGAIAASRDRIRQTFQARGQPYDGQLASAENDMFKSVMPIAPLDQPIHWWTAKPKR